MFLRVFFNGNLGFSRALVIQGAGFVLHKGAFWPYKYYQRNFFISIIFIFMYSFTFTFTVPLDLDIQLKAVLIGSAFLVVSLSVIDFEGFVRKGSNTSRGRRKQTTGETCDKF